VFLYTDPSCSTAPQLAPLPHLRLQLRDRVTAAYHAK
jgi:hypothetical protein